MTINYQYVDPHFVGSLSGMAWTELNRLHERIMQDRRIFNDAVSFVAEQQRDAFKGKDVETWDSGRKKMDAMLDLQLTVSSYYLDCITEIMESK